MGDLVLVLLTPQGSFLLSEIPVAGVYGSGATHSPDGSFLCEVKHLWQAKSGNETFILTSMFIQFEWLCVSNFNMLLDFEFR